ncbi:MAG TPA: KH domain-containing protein [Edaphobacter sp.]|nr:KH domain-containing protein [Edaphobacter sp.]
MDEAMQLASGNDSDQKMSDLVAELARALVDKPEEVSVETIQDGDGTLLRLHVAQSDVGKVIGKQGRTARSIRTVLSAASMKLKRRFSLDIVEETRAL